MQIVKLELTVHPCDIYTCHDNTDVAQPVEGHSFKDTVQHFCLKTVRQDMKCGHDCATEDVWLLCFRLCWSILVACLLLCQQGDSVVNTQQRFSGLNHQEVLGPSYSVLPTVCLSGFCCFLLQFRHIHSQYSYICEYECWACLCIYISLEIDWWPGWTPSWPYSISVYQLALAPAHYNHAKMDGCYWATSTFSIPGIQSCLIIFVYKDDCAAV